MEGLIFGILRYPPPCSLMVLTGVSLPTLTGSVPCSKTYRRLFFGDLCVNIQINKRLINN